jgi:hypothetical protein
MVMVSTTRDVATRFLKVPKNATTVGILESPGGMIVVPSIVVISAVAAYHEECSGPLKRRTAMTVSITTAMLTVPTAMIPTAPPTRRA